MTFYATSCDSVKVPEAALRYAVSVLSVHGFEIIQLETNRAVLTGPGMTSTKQNPILGATKILLTLDENTLSADAELGGVDSMQRFLKWFPPSLCVFLAVPLMIGGGILFGQQFGVGFGVPWAQGWRWILFAGGLAMLPATPWLVLTPFMTKWIRNRTENALSTLVRNACLADSTSTYVARASS